MKKTLITILFGFIFSTNHSFAEVNINNWNEDFEIIEKVIKNEKLEKLLNEKINKVIEKRTEEIDVNEVDIINNNESKSPTKQWYTITLWIWLLIFFALIFWIFWKKTRKKELMKIISEKENENELIETKRLEKKIVPRSNENHFWKKMNELTRNHIEDLTKKDLNNLTNIEIIEAFQDLFEKNKEIKEILLEVNKWIYWRSKRNKEELAKQLHVLINIEK